MSTVVCVTGMHRSGTSLTASWLQVCGMTIDDGRLYGPGPGNPQGHFEDADFAELHRGYLAGLNPRSRGWIITERLRFDPGVAFLAAAQELVTKRNLRYKLWGWKDPRTTLFLEAWKQTIPGLKVLLLWRPCYDVVRSLIKRKQKTSLSDYQIGWLRAIKTWRTYNHALLDFRQHHPYDSIVLPIYDLIERDRETIGLINQRFGLSLQWQPLAGVYDPKLLEARRFSVVASCIGRVMQIYTTEQMLQRESDRLGVTS